MSNIQALLLKSPCIQHWVHYWLIQMSCSCFITIIEDDKLLEKYISSHFYHSLVGCKSVTSRSQTNPLVSHRTQSNQSFHVKIYSDGDVILRVVLTRRDLTEAVHWHRTVRPRERPSWDAPEAIWVRRSHCARWKASASFGFLQGACGARLWPGTRLVALLLGDLQVGLVQTLLHGLESGRRTNQADCASPSKFPYW